MDRHTRREFLRRGAVAGVVVAGVPIVRTFDVAAFGQAGSTPVTPATTPTSTPTSPGPQVLAAEQSPAAKPAGGSGATVGGSSGTFDPGSLPFTGGNPVALGTVGAATAGAGAALLRSRRRARAAGVGHDAEHAKRTPLERLDDVLWAYETPVLGAFGYAFTVRTSDARLGRHVEQLLAAFRSASGAAPSTGAEPHVLSLRDRGAAIQPRFASYVDDRLVAADADASLVLAALLSAIDRGAVEAAASTHLLVHGAAAGTHAGCALLVGPSGAGKTTLVTALVRSGLGYVADEIVAFAPGSTAAACYQKPISLEGPARFLSGDLRDVAVLAPGRAAARWHVAPAMLRGDPLARSSPVRAVFSVRHRAGSATTIDPMSESDALTLLVANSFNGDRLDDVAFDTASTIVRDAPAFRLSFGDLDTACALVRHALGA